MKKVVLCLILCMVVILPGVAGCTAAPAAPASGAVKPAASGNEPFTIDLRSQQFGTITYIIGTAMEELTKNHPWLHVSNSESPGAAWSAEYIGSTPSARTNCMTTYSALTVDQAFKGEDTFKGKPQLEMKNYKAVISCNIMLIHFMTFNPNIKTVNDLAGKNVGMGTKGGGAWATIPAMMFDDLGIKANLQYLGNNQSQQALVEGKVDAAICCTYTNVEGTKTIPNEVYTATVAVPGKQSYIVSWGEANCSKLQKDLGALIAAQKVPANVFKNQPEPVWLMTSAGGFGVHTDFPERAITELIKIWGANYSKFVDRHEQMQIISLESMAKGYGKECYHPAAIKAYESMGVKW